MFACNLWHWYIERGAQTLLCSTPGLQVWKGRRTDDEGDQQAHERVGGDEGQCSRAAGAGRCRLIGQAVAHRQLGQHAEEPVRQVVALGVRQHRGGASCTNGLRFCSRDRT